MAEYKPFVLLDDARAEGASDAQLFEDPSEIFVARRPEEVLPVLEAAEAARKASGGTLAGYLAYEAGLALEPKLAPLAAARTGADGPLVWFGLFDAPKLIPTDQVADWLAERAGSGPASIGPLQPQISTGAYLDAFATLQEAIRAGDIYQANLTMPLAGAARGDPLALYAAIRPAANAGYGGVIFDGSHWLLSFSPELFFSLKGDAAKAKPMKGTRPRGQTPDEDKALADELAGSAKDKAENLMIVDLLRNDLSRVAVAGTVKVEDLFTIETYPTLHTMVSTVRAQLRPGQDAMDMVRALFPCGSITGAPKVRAMELIDAVERDARGPYCGSMGRIGTDEAAFNVAIRTIRLTPGENDRHHAVLGVGGAIVADSDGMAEWRECLIKGGFAREAAGGHDLIETMRFDPQEGMPLLELHLERMKASAAELGFAFDRHEVRNRIHALCFELEAPAKVRLVVSRRGEASLETAPLPPAPEGTVECVALPVPVVPGDWRLRHKTTDRGFHDAALAIAKDNGAYEVIFVCDDGEVTEGSFTNLFVERNGKLLTPPLSAGLLPGILRRALIEEGRAIEARLTLEDLAGGFLIGNALRGLMPARMKT
ncbi:aminodeoxychorismate synthase component I [Altererythrobacter sp. Root672]|uniref:aminodeoxychorismate synthase component I n=1 Tax=Altererythrobacter sp. Root672 TaxID=1736584 RepID=UPI0007021687|nr:aminodeoxychorismate synthase component I [Altererythrobacter sp. Root672]KRA80411.1 aminobenzoate synthetase [Altererythrobacter sp. Root672]